MQIFVMKISTTFAICLFSLILQGQSLPIDFEGDVLSSDFVDFDGGTATVIPNPNIDGINTSETVAQIVRNGGAIWSGSKIALDQNLDFTTLNTITMKVFTTAPVGTIVKFKLEGNGSAERDVQTTLTGEWEELSWDFTGTPTDFDNVVFMFDFGNVGDGSEASTFLFDDIARLFGGIQIDLPVDFEGADINYTMTDFGGNESILETDPEDETNTVIKVTKTIEAATWAGTTIGTPAGFATDIPLTLSSSVMSARVWSPAAGTPIRLKVEDSNDPTHTCETQTNTTRSEAWETIEFDFANQAPGTESLAVGLSFGWKYNMASIFFNFGTEGTIAGEQTYYFDDVAFGKVTTATAEYERKKLSVAPNPTNDFWELTATDSKIKSIQLYNQTGQLIRSYEAWNNGQLLEASGLTPGVYTARVQTLSEDFKVRLVKY